MNQMNQFERVLLEQKIRSATSHELREVLRVVAQTASDAQLQEALAMLGHEESRRKGNSAQ